MRYMKCMLVILLAVSVFSIGCEGKTGPTGPQGDPAPVPTEIVVVAAGQCVAVGEAGIQCADDSHCTEDGKDVSCQSVNWQVTDSATGIQGPSRTSGQSRTVQFDGLAPHKHSILQTTTHMSVTDTAPHNVNLEP